MQRIPRNTRTPPRRLQHLLASPTLRLCHALQNTWKAKKEKSARPQSTNHSLIMLNQHRNKPPSRKAIGMMLLTSSQRTNGDALQAVTRLACLQHSAPTPRRGVPLYFGMPCRGWSHREENCPHPNFDNDAREHHYGCRGSWLSFDSNPTSSPINICAQVFRGI